MVHLKQHIMLNEKVKNIHFGVLNLFSELTLKKSDIEQLIKTFI